MVGLVLMADYFCAPLWHAGGEQVGPVEPSGLPLSAETRQRLGAWADAWDAILVMDDPASSDFPSPEARLAWEEEGRVLLERLRAELPGVPIELRLPRW